MILNSRSVIISIYIITRDVISAGDHSSLILRAEAAQHYYCTTSVMRLRALLEIKSFSDEDFIFFKYFISRQLNTRVNHFPLPRLLAKCEKYGFLEDF